jgi:hypothetical protein
MNYRAIGPARPPIYAPERVVNDDLGEVVSTQHRISTMRKCVLITASLLSHFGLQFGERESGTQAERRLERSRSAMRAAVPQMEAERGCAFPMFVHDERALRGANVRWSRTLRPN